MKYLIQVGYVRIQVIASSAELAVMKAKKIAGDFPAVIIGCESL